MRLITAMIPKNSNIHSGREVFPEERGEFDDPVGRVIVVGKRADKSYDNGGRFSEAFDSCLRARRNFVSPGQGYEKSADHPRRDAQRMAHVHVDCIKSI